MSVFSGHGVSLNSKQFVKTISHSEALNQRLLLCQNRNRILRKKINMDKTWEQTHIQNIATSKNVVSLCTVYMVDMTIKL